MRHTPRFGGAKTGGCSGCGPIRSLDFRAQAHLLSNAAPPRR
jgi:hypothetical protein